LLAIVEGLVIVEQSEDKGPDFYKMAIIKPFSISDEERFHIFQTLCPLAKKLKVTGKEIKKYRVRTDLFDIDPLDEDIFADNIVDFDSPSPWIDRDFAFQLAYEMDDLKSLKWYERTVDRCDRVGERQILLRARGEILEMENSEDKPKNKGALFLKLVRTYGEERGISLGDYKSALSNDAVMEKREIVKRKREVMNKFVEEIKSTMTVEELCLYYDKTLKLITKECGTFFTDNGIDIPSYIINSYMNRIIGEDYGRHMPEDKLMAI
jgi:hypothetical protein